MFRSYIVFFLVVVAFCDETSIKQNFKEATETDINAQINRELEASYAYQSLANYCSKNSVALPGLNKYFKSMSDEETSHARLFMEYQNKRGGAIKLLPIKPPAVTNQVSALSAMKAALKMEQTILDHLYDIYSRAATHNDINFMSFLEDNFINPGVEDIKEMADYVTQLERVGPGLGVFQFDQKLL